MITAFQRDAFQNDAFQIAAEPTRQGALKYPSYRTYIPYTITGRIKETQYHNIEEIKLAVIINCAIINHGFETSSIIETKIKTKNEIDIEELLLMIMLDS